MILFPEFIVIGMIILSLGLTLAGLIILIGMLLRDRKSKTIW